MYNNNEYKKTLRRDKGDRPSSDRTLRIQIKHNLLNFFFFHHKRFRHRRPLRRREVLSGSVNEDRWDTRGFWCCCIFL